MPPQYLRELEPSGSNIQIRRVLQAIMKCRTGALGGVKWGCSKCGHTHWTGRSCGNRHCATCGSEKTQAWLDKQSGKLLVGVHHFMVTFTVPQELRDLLRTHRRAGYEALMQASASALIDVAAATRALIRYHGWMCSSSKTRLEEIRMLVWFALGWIYWMASAIGSTAKPNSCPKPPCPRCQSPLQVQQIEMRPVWLERLNSHSHCRAPPTINSS